MSEAIPAAAFTGEVRAAAVGEAVRILNKRLRKAARRFMTPSDLAAALRVNGMGQRGCVRLSRAEADAVAAEFRRAGWEVDQAPIGVIVRLPKGAGS